jgi:hypothetical protein
VSNSFEENVCENANTLAHVVDHMVVLAHLRRRRSLSGREGLGPSLPPAKLARQDSGVFEELKRLFSTTLKIEKETEANGGQQGDRHALLLWVPDQTLWFREGPNASVANPNTRAAPDCYVELTGRVRSHRDRVRFSVRSPC